MLALELIGALAIRRGTESIAHSLIGERAGAERIDQLRSPPKALGEIEDRRGILPKPGARHASREVGLRGARGQRYQMFCVPKGARILPHGRASQRPAPIELSVLRLTRDRGIEVGEGSIVLSPLALDQSAQETQVGSVG